MVRKQSRWIQLVVIAMVTVSMALVGCGPSKQQQQMSGFLVEYTKAVDAFEVAAGKADTNGMSEEKAKIESYISQWTTLKNDLGSELTPQVLNELDDQFKNITKKYEALAASA